MGDIFVCSPNTITLNTQVSQRDGFYYNMTLTQEVTYNIVGQIKPGKPKSREWVRPLWLIFNVGWYVALSIIIPSGIGYWLDRPERFDTRPMFSLIGFGIGTLVAFYGLYRMLRQFYNEQKEQQKSTESKQ